MRAAWSVRQAAAYELQREAISAVVVPLLQRLTLSAWNIRLAALSTLQQVARRLYLRPSAGEEGAGGVSPGPSLLTGAAVESLIGGAAQGLADHKYAVVRAAAVGVLVAVLARQGVEARIAVTPFTERIEELVARAIVDDAAEVMRAATQARTHLHGLLR
jgi:hypothetical protein